MASRLVHVWTETFPSRQSIGEAQHTVHLYVPVQLSQDAGLAGKQELPEAELRHHAGLPHGVPRLPPGGRQQLGYIIARLVASCTT